MKKLKFLLVFVILLVLFVGVVSATETIQEDNTYTNDETVVSDTSTISQSNEKIIDNEGNNLKESNLDRSTYSELAKEIGTGGIINLQHDYYTYDYGSTINITENYSIIDGRGAVIDMSGSFIQAFNVYTKNVHFVNLTIKNANYRPITSSNYNEFHNGSAIQFHMNGSLFYCNFINNQAYGSGGAIYFGHFGRVYNCNFTDNYASTSGGAIYFKYSGNVEETNFINNSARVDGGAIWSDQFNGTSSNYINNNASTFGGALSVYNATISNSTFSNNTAYNGGAIKIIRGPIEGCTFVNNNATGNNGGAVYFYNGTVNKSNFTNNKAKNGGAIFFEYFNDATVTNSCFINNSASENGGAIQLNAGNIKYSTFINNSATKEGGAIYDKHEGITNTEVAKCDFRNNKASHGGSIYFNDTARVDSCNFTDNNATASGSAVYYAVEGEIVMSNFINNTASVSGTVWFGLLGTVYGCNFTNNRAITGNGGGLWFAQSSLVYNCNLINNSAKNGAGMYCYGRTNTERNNFINNHASADGGGLWINSGNIKNCNFTNNNATSYGGAIYITSGNIANSNFNNNNASIGGGIYSKDESGNLSTSNFKNNNAKFYGGAVYFSIDANVTDCNFTNNSAQLNSGALTLHSGNIKNCNFIDNQVTYDIGGAVSLSNGNIEYSNFEKNIARTGSAIYFFNSSKTKNISHSRFLNNRANVDNNTPLHIVKNGNNIEITFIGQDNFLNAIFSEDDIKVTNVTYWGANGITNTSNNTITLSKSNNESGQNISVSVTVNDIVISNMTNITDSNGKIILDAIAGNYKITARHDTDLYYTEAETTETFNNEGIETILELSASEFTCIARISPNDVEGKIIFTVENESGIVRTSEEIINGGISKINLTGLDEGKYNINATYKGNINYYPTKANITYELKKLSPIIIIQAANITKNNPEIINITVNNAKDKNITVHINEKEYNINNGSITLTNLEEGLYNVTAIWNGDNEYTNGTNSTTFKVNGDFEANVTNYNELVEAIENATREEYITYKINLLPGDYNATQNITWNNSATPKITINGNGNTLDGQNTYPFINIAERHELILDNITIRNYTSDRGAIYNNGTLTISNSTLENNKGFTGGTIDNNNGTVIISNSKLNNNEARRGGAIFNVGTLTISNSTFENNSAVWEGGAIFGLDLFDSSITLFNSNFTSNYADKGAAIYNDEHDGYGIYNITKNLFRNNFANNKETLNFNNKERVMEENTYEYTDILLEEITLSINDNIFKYGEDIVLNYTIKPANPDNYYDLYEGLNDITIYINSEKNTTTRYENTTLNTLKPGTYTVYYTTCNQQSNNVTFTVMADSQIKTPETTYEYYNGANNNIPLIITDISEQKGTITVTVKDQDEYKKLFISFNVEDEYNLSSQRIVEELENLYKNLNSSYIINVTYSGDYANPSSTEFTLNINKKKNTTITVNPIQSSVGLITNLSANVIDVNNKPVNGGLVVFKINGITLKDENNNVIYANVNNGLASINYKVQSSWIKNTSYIEAVYGGTESYASSRIKTSEALNISQGTVNITMEKELITAKTDETITLRVKILDSKGDRINKGKVIFKLNGITLKDKNGKTLSAQVIDGDATLEYTIPPTFSAKTYTLTAVYSEKNYQRTETNSTLTLEKKGITINTDNITTTNNKTTIKATITDETEKLLVKNTKITIKVNGKTVLNNATSNNGKIDVSFNVTFKPGMYELLIISAENGIYKSGKMTTVLKI